MKVIAETIRALDEHSLPYNDHSEVASAALLGASVQMLLAGKWYSWDNPSVFHTGAKYRAVVYEDD